MKIIVLLFLLGLLSLLESHARPQYSILQSYGARCTGCHINTMGGGARNGPGFLARKDISLIKPSWLGLDGLFDFVGQSNSFVNDKVLFGFDMRVQSAKFGSPTNPKRDIMFMQGTPYLAISPVNWLQIEGQYNLAYELESNKRYPGQDKYCASIHINPGESLPSLRIGYFQPFFGMKWDDHTMLVRTTASQGRSLPLVPHEYAEWGAQVDYSPCQYLDLSAGAMNSNNFSRLKITNYANEQEPMVSPVRLSYIFRAGIFPPDLFGLTSFMGFTYFLNGGIGFGDRGIKLGNDYFYIFDAYFNIGINDKFAIMTEYTTSEKQYAITTDNFLAELDYQLMEPIILYVRAERGTTRQRIFQDDYFYLVNQFVFGAHINLLPFIELIPEYRIYDREAYSGHQAQWAFQLHVFY